MGGGHLSDPGVMSRGHAQVALLLDRWKRMEDTLMVTFGFRDEFPVTIFIGSYLKILLFLPLLTVFLGFTAHYFFPLWN